MKHLITAAIFCVLLLTIIEANAKNINIRDRIETKNFYRSVYDTLFGEENYRTTSSFYSVINQQPNNTKQKIDTFIKRLDRVLPAQILMPLTYWRLVSPEPEKVADIISFAILYKLLVIRDYIDNPLTDPANVDRAKEILKNVSENDETSSQNLFSLTIPNIKSFSKRASAERSDEAFIAMVNSNHVIKENIKNNISDIQDYITSYLGYIPGNIVEFISKNDTSTARIDWVNERVVFNGGSLDFSKDYMKMPSGPSQTGHIAFVQDPIFIKIRDMISQAKESIFIDIFLFGGTMGGTLAKYLIDQTLNKRKLNPYFKTLILHDYSTNYTMWPEMKPVFEYIRDSIKSDPEVADAITLLQANIQRHPPGVPLRITDLIPKTPEVFNIIESRDTYYESKIDHSKVIVVDAKSDRPKAYFGSKNWTDHSGSYYYDNAIYVEGPAAAVVQASYYDDVEAALTSDPAELEWFYYKNQGFDNKHYLGKKDEILSWMRIERNSYPSLNDEISGIVKIAEADVDGKIKDVRNTLVDMIKKAKSHIYMEHLFFYDRYIVDSLLKKKKSNPDVDIKIIIDKNENFGMNGFPNTIFLKSLMDAGVEIRERDTVGRPIRFPNGTEREYNQEDHRKVSDVDGIMLLGGSSNINPDTLQGSFREFGAQIFDQKEIAKFEKDFLADWDSNKTLDCNIDAFKFKLGEKELPLALSAAINDFAATLIRSKDHLEGKQ